MHKYRLVSKKGEGTFSEVLKAQSVVTGEYFAVKCMKNHFKSLEQVNSLREIQALQRLNHHKNIIDLEEVLYDEQTGRLALVFELMDMNIYELIRKRKQYVNSNKIKLMMYQLVKAVAHMHNEGIFHRDIKPENILIMGDELKVADFGSCRGIFTNPPYTEYISTRWYRAPECLLTNGYYDYKMDMWGIGCVFFEVVSLFPLFPGTNELDQIEKVHNILGTPSQEIINAMKKYSSHIKNFNFPPKKGSGIPRLIPHAHPDCIDLIEQLLIYDPAKRITARQALQHPYFKELREAENRQRIHTASPKLGLSSQGGELEARERQWKRDREKAEARKEKRKRKEERKREKEKERQRLLEEKKDKEKREKKERDRERERDREHKETKQKQEKKSNQTDEKSDLPLISRLESSINNNSSTNSGTKGGLPVISRTRAGGGGGGDRNASVSSNKGNNNNDDEKAATRSNVEELKKTAAAEQRERDLARERERKREKERARELERERNREEMKEILNAARNRKKKKKNRKAHYLSSGSSKRGNFPTIGGGGGGGSRKNNKYSNSGSNHSFNLTASSNPYGSSSNNSRMTSSTGMSYNPVSTSSYHRSNKNAGSNSGSGSVSKRSVMGSTRLGGGSSSVARALMAANANLNNIDTRSRIRNGKKTKHAYLKKHQRNKSNHRSHMRGLAHGLSSYGSQRHGGGGGRGSNGLQLSVNNSFHR